MQQKIGTVTSDYQALATQFKALQSGLNDRDKSLAKTDVVKAEIAALSAKLAGVTSSLDVINSREAEQRKNANNVLLSLELANLKRAIDTGRPYSTELAQVQNLAGDDIDLAGLSQYKNETILSTKALTNSFRKVARTVLSVEPGKQGGTIMDSILSSAKSVIRVRKVGDVQGTTTDAMLARMEAKLKAKDLGGVLTEAKSLPEPGRKVASDWLKQIEARHTIDRSLEQLEGRFKSSLRTPGEGQAQ